MIKSKSFLRERTSGDQRERMRARTICWREGVTMSSGTDSLAREWLMSGMACPMKWKKLTQLQSSSVYTDVTMWALWRPPENDEKYITIGKCHRAPTSSSGSYADRWRSTDKVKKVNFILYLKICYLGMAQITTCRLGQLNFNVKTI